MLYTAAIISASEEHTAARSLYPLTRRALLSAIGFYLSTALKKETPIENQVIIEVH
jgi:hypothetical protein